MVKIIFTVWRGRVFWAGDEEEMCAVTSRPATLTPIWEARTGFPGVGRIGACCFGNEKVGTCPKSQTWHGKGQIFPNDCWNHEFWFNGQTCAPCPSNASLWRKLTPAEPTEVQSHKTKWDHKTLRLMTLCVIPNSYLKRAFLKLNYLHQETKRCPEKALSHHAIALMSLALACMSKLWFPCGKLGLQRHVVTSWLHVQLEAKYKGLTSPGKTPGQRENCCVHIPCLTQNLPPQLASCSFCFQN